MGITCPNCHKPVSGTPRACGYCGTSLVREYFSAPAEKAPRTNPESTAGGVAATVLGVFGGLSVLGALAFSLMLLLRGEAQDPLAGLTLFWWLRIAAMTMLPPIYLAQLAAQRGIRYSVVFDAIWLPLWVCGLGVTLQAFFGQGAAAFDGQTAIAYLLALGCGLASVASVIGIFSVK